MQEFRFDLKNVTLSFSIVLNDDETNTVNIESLALNEIEKLINENEKVEGIKSIIPNSLLKSVVIYPSVNLKPKKIKIYKSNLKFVDKYDYEGEWL